MMAAESTTSPRVTGLNIFPIKSCKALRVEEIEVDAYGVVEDRRFMLVDGNGRFTSQRKFSKLATMRAWFEEEEGEGDGEGGGEGEGTQKSKRRKNSKQLLCVSAPGMARDLKISPKLQGERRGVSVWESQVRAVDQGDEAAQWFSDAIGAGSVYHRLIASGAGDPSESSGEAFHRLVDNLPASLKQRLPPMKMALADSGPVSLISSESLSDLNRRLEERGVKKVSLDRFRMNIEISGCSAPFEEDEWLLVRIGTVPFLVYTNAERCKVTCINQDTGEQDKLGPLDILREYRAPRGPTHAMFGQLMVPLQAGGRVRVGDRVQVLERKKGGGTARR